MIELIRRHPREHIALIEASRQKRIGYGELLDRADAAAERLKAAAGARPLAFLAMAPDCEAVILYLACLSAQIPLCLAEPSPESLAKLARVYEPDLLLLPVSFEAPPGYAEHPSPAESYRLWLRPRAAPPVIHPGLALLLTTSGSTGSPKLVRLTGSNLSSNALSIGRYLALGPDERAIASLPMHYSYGLSVLNSHLVAGGSVVVTPHSFMRPEFWAAADGEHCTSFAGVPYMYETLHRLRFDPGRHPALRTLTQAGGALRRDLTAHVHGLALKAGARLFVMYGQTEATARISYVPPEDLHRKIGSIGVPIPGGRMHLSPIEGPGGLAEIVYEGPNVMMGYAESTEDLALGDVLAGVLKTGDLGHVDEDGFYYVSGRLKRFAKLFGRRVSLEDVERELEARYPVQVAAVDGGDRIVVYAQSTDPVDFGEMGAWVSRMLSVPPGAVAVLRVGALPRTSSGKKDYRALEVSA